MKKVILSVAAVFAFGFANAQETTEGAFSKGSMFVSGSVGFESSKFGDAKSNDLQFSPAFGYFLADNIALGARLNVSSGKDEAGIAETKRNGFGAEVFGRYYWTPASKFSVFGELAVGFGTDKTETGPLEEKYNTFGVNAGVGVSYFLSSSWALEAKWAGLGYNSRKEDGADDAENTFDIKADLSNINLGLIYKF